MIKVVLKALVGSFIICMISCNKSKTFRVALPGNWGSLIPATQHTAYAAVILDNIFDSLVRRDETGIIVPSLAKEWIISEDYKSIEFILDENAVFSNGEKLTSQHIKNSWLNGLSLESKVDKHSLYDVLSFTEGFKDQDGKFSLPGVQIVSPNKVKVNFKFSFRLALDHLSGKRFGIYIKENGQYLGTGSYKISKEEDNHLVLEKSPFAKSKESFERIEIEVHKEISENKVDLVLFAENFKSIPSQFKVELGQIYAHQVIIVNGKSSAIFNDLENRKALNYQISTEKEDILISKYSTRSPQVYQALQAGSLDDKELNSSITKLSKHSLKKLKRLSRVSPIKVARKKGDNTLINYLISLGINVDSSLEFDNFTDFQNTIYNTGEFDIAQMSISVITSDPDGIYHALGKEGAISVPFMEKNNTELLLETGKKLFKRKEIDAHYKAVSNSIIIEVPFIHLSHKRKVIAYNSSKIALTTLAMQRNSYRFDNFIEK